MICSQRTAAQIGSARGYQGLSALLAISTGGEQQAAQAVFLCIASAGRECAHLPHSARLSAGVVAAAGRGCGGLGYFGGGPCNVPAGLPDPAV
jgi:hypothetical protein